MNYIAAEAYCSADYRGTRIEQIYNRFITVIDKIFCIRTYLGCELDDLNNFLKIL